MYFSRIRIRPDVRDLHLLLNGNGYGAHQLLWKLFPSQDEGRTFLFREEVAKEQIPFHKGVKGEPIFYTVSAIPPLTEHPVFAAESKPYAPKLVAGDRLAFRLRANPTIARRTAGKKNCIRHDIVMDAQRGLLSELAERIGIIGSGKKSALKRAILETGRLQNEGEPSCFLRDRLRTNERYQEIADKKYSPVALLESALKACSDQVLESWFINKGEQNGFALVRDKRNGRLKFQAEGYQWYPLPKKGKTAGFSAVDFEGEIDVLDPDRFSKILFSGIGPAKGFGCGLMLVRRI